jgi:hypothetical protein
MAIGSRINPNFPIPGLDQSSKGFRDNFAITKREIEDIQNTTIQLDGAVSSAPHQLGENNGSIVINTTYNGGNITLEPPLHAIQYNNDRHLTGNVNLVYDSGNITVGIGTSLPNPSVSIDAVGPIHAGSNIIIGNVVTSYSNLCLASSNVAIFSNCNDHVEIGSQDNIPVQIIINSLPRIHINTSGNVGIGTTTPLAALHVIGNTREVGIFSVRAQDSDSMVRSTTNAINSTIGYGLEHRLGDTLGGMRINQDGLLTLHTGESMDADLSTTSARVSIDADGRVAIGLLSTSHSLEVNGTFKSPSILDNSFGAQKLVGINHDDPFYTLDVRGDIGLSGGLVSKAVPFSNPIGTSPVMLDTWSMDEIRSASYIVQVLNGNDPSEQVDVMNYVATHANGTAYGNEMAIFSTGSRLGSLGVSVNTGFIELYYTGTAAENTVKLSKTYITN